MVSYDLSIYNLFVRLVARCESIQAGLAEKNWMRSMLMDS